VDPLTELINAAQSLLDSGLDLQAFLDWRTVAFLSLLSLLGPLHYYTKTFSRLTRDARPPSLLAGTGVLVAAREEICRGEGGLPDETSSASESNEPGHPKLNAQRGNWCPLCVVQEAYKG